MPDNNYQKRKKSNIFDFSKYKNKRNSTLGSTSQEDSEEDAESQKKKKIRSLSSFLSILKRYSEENSYDENDQKESAEEPVDTSDLRLRDIELPTALARRVMKQYISGVAFAIFVSAFAIFYGQVNILIGLLISVLFIVLGIKTTYDYAGGKIAETPVVCTAVSSAGFGRNTRVTFSTTDETPSFLQFIVSGKLKSCDITPQTAYIIYYYYDDPGELLGYIPV